VTWEQDNGVRPMAPMELEDTGFSHSRHNLNKNNGAYLNRREGTITLYHSLSNLSKDSAEKITPTAKNNTICARAGKRYPQQRQFGQCNTSGKRWLPPLDSPFLANSGVGWSSERQPRDVRNRRNGPKTLALWDKVKVPTSGYARHSQQDEHCIE